MSRTTTERIEPIDYWKKVFGIETYKIEWHFKRLLYKVFGITLPKLASQQDYWQRRGQVYFDEISSSGYLDREVFFQNMLVESLMGIDFTSFFEAGCGFGWNIGRVKQEFPETFVGGVDFSLTQLLNSHRYLEGMDVPVVNGDACHMPLNDNAFDVGFSLGVFMNIHPDNIRTALSEMLRVCGKYIIHIEYDQDNTTPELREKRAFKTNIVSHDYRALYKELGAEVVEFRTYKDFGSAYHAHAKRVSSDLDRWEGFEGPEKYVFVVVKV